MATVSLLGSTINTTSGTHTVVATPAVNDLIVIARANSGAVTSVTPTDTASGTYTLVSSAFRGASSNLMEVYVRDTLITSATSTTFSDAAGTTTGGGLVVMKITGMVVGGTTAIRQSAKEDNKAAAATPAPVFGSVPLSVNPVIGFLFNATSPATMTPRTGYSEDLDVGYSTPTAGVEVMHRDSGESSATITWGGSSAGAFGDVVIELQSNIPPTVALNTPADAGTVSTLTPQLAFTGTDADSDTASYHIQVDTVSTFDSTSTTPAFVQSATPGTNATGSTNTTATSAFGASNTIHNAIIVGVIVDSTSATTSVADTAVNTYTLQAKYPTSGNRYLEIWACFDIKAQASNVITYTQGFNDGVVFAHEYSSLTALDVSATGTSTNASPTATTATTTTQKQLVYSIMEMDIVSANSINSVGSGYTNFQTASSSNVIGAVESKIVTSTGAQTATFNVTNAGGGTWRLLVATFTAVYSPLIDKVSASDPGFVDITNGAHSDPFVSGEQVGYTVQSALTNSTTYYWRTQAKDPTGSARYGAYPTVRSFTVALASGAPNKIVQVRQAINRASSF